MSSKDGLQHETLISFFFLFLQFMLSFHIRKGAKGLDLFLKQSEVFPNIAEIFFSYVKQLKKQLA